MKKIARFICMLLSLAMVIGTLAACGGGVDDGLDNEKDVFTMTLGEPDNVFSPFFSTSAYDSEVWGTTQISMLSTNALGKPYCGEDEPTMALNYNQTIYIKGEAVPEDQVEAKTADLSEAEKENGDLYYTKYEFLVKNGVKDSTGTPLTIKDVLFNMYVYLDPMYTGSSTMYSTDIKGLDAYRAQDAEISDIEADNFEKTFVRLATDRELHIGSYFSNDEDIRNAYRAIVDTETENEIIDDAIYARELFWQELLDDWATATSVVSDKNDFDFTEDEAWKYFLVSYGIIPVTYETDGTIALFEEGDQEVISGEYQAGQKKIFVNDCLDWYHDKENLLKIVYNAKLGVLPTDEQGSPVASAGAKPNIDLVLDRDLKVTGNKLSDSELREAIKSNEMALVNNLPAIVSYYATAAKMDTFWVADEKEKYFEEHADDANIPKTISGITVDKYTAGQTFYGKDSDTQITEDQYAVVIEINGVDPKAIWNFAVTVAPMHYYSNPEACGMASKYAGQGYKYFNYPGTEGYDATKEPNMGFDNFSQGYLTDVVQSVNKLPVGAGTYMASNSTGAETGVKATEFYINNVVYYVRNPYFETTGKEINNAKIKYIQYKVIATTAILNSLENGEVHYGMPNAKTEIIEQVNANKNLASFQPKTNGYGYIGINAGFIKDINLRRAIMTAMDTSYIKSYYANSCEIITRPMSTNSWAYPHGAADAYPYSDYSEKEYSAEVRREDAITKVQAYLDQVSMRMEKSSKDGKLRVYDEDKGKWVKLKYTFTIAGAETDHPAYLTFSNAASILNELGFEITVLPDAMALSKLSAGKLEVWAAAWGAGIDPDMYQIYHKDSKATSVNNWGYKYLLDSNSKHVTEERDILDDLAIEIENGRSSLDQDIRASYYEVALDYVMDLAVEYPTYQRNDLCVVNKKVIDTNTINNNPTPYEGVFSRFWEVSFVTKK
ncbi:MAG: hypothetical protein IJD07_02205 [Clostridia bacterium]|nr:hypothetical protein [Clostridia bacterium]